jgi:glycosyltransferase involved in cell wall biosynthesis
VGPQSRDRPSRPHDVTDPVPSPDLELGAVHRAMAERAARSGIQRVHLLAFRDEDDLEAGGSEVYVAQVCRHLAAAGLEVTRHTGRVSGEADDVVRDGVRVVRRGGRLGVFGRTVLDERSGRLGPADGIVEVFHGVPFFAPVWARRTPQVGIVHHVHLGVWRHLLPLPGAAVGHLAERFAVPAVYRRRRLVSIAPSSRLEVLRAYRADPDQVTVATSGVDDRFTMGGERAATPTVVAVARLMPQKGVDRLLDAFASVRREVPSAELVVVGSGPEHDRLVRQAADLDLADAVTFAGYATPEELVDWYRRAWVVTSASLREGYGLTLQEAAACGTPSVASRISGHIDAVQHGVTGLLADDDAALASSIVAVLTDPELRDRLGRAALVHATGCRWEHTAAAVLDALCDDADHRR